MELQCFAELFRRHRSIPKYREKVELYGCEQHLRSPEGGRCLHDVTRIEFGAHRFLLLGSEARDPPAYRDGSGRLLERARQGIQKTRQIPGVASSTEWPSGSRK